MYHFLPDSLWNHPTWLQAYRQSLTVPYDDFLENYILESDFYRMEIDGSEIGLVGIHGNLLTYFFVAPVFLHQAHSAFAAVLAQFSLAEAFVPTSDRHFLNVVLEFSQTFSIQALHFSPTERPVRPPEFPANQLRAATPTDLNAVVNLTGDFLDKWEDRINRQEIFLLEDSGEILGLGVLVKNVLMEHCLGTGMFTRPEARQRGVGRSIILHLKDMVRRRGFTPVPGCWYFNHESRRTLESAGYLAVSKLLRFSFTRSLPPAP